MKPGAAKLDEILHNGSDIGINCRGVCVSCVPLGAEPPREECWWEP